MPRALLLIQHTYKAAAALGADCKQTTPALFQSLPTHHFSTYYFSSLDIENNFSSQISPVKLMR